MLAPTNWPSLLLHRTRCQWSVAAGTAAAWLTTQSSPGIPGPKAEPPGALRWTKCFWGGDTLAATHGCAVRSKWAPVRVNNTLPVRKILKVLP
jgi:hypothetical protein